jgi:hypothetical protein
MGAVKSACATVFKAVRSVATTIASWLEQTIEPQTISDMYKHQNMIEQAKNQEIYAHYCTALEHRSNINNKISEIKGVMDPNDLSKADAYLAGLSDAIKCSGCSNILMPGNQISFSGNHSLCLSGQNTSYITCCWCSSTTYIAYRHLQKMGISFG